MIYRSLIFSRNRCVASSGLLESRSFLVELRSRIAGLSKELLEISQAFRSYSGMAFSFAFSAVPLFCYSIAGVDRFRMLITAVGPPNYRAIAYDLALELADVSHVVFDHLD